MKDVFVGDRVRLLHMQGEGVVVRVIDDSQIEVAIDNDFSIPVLRREVVLISPGEKKLLKQEGVKPASQAATQAAARLNDALPVVKGIFLGVNTETTGLSTLFLINNTELQLVFTLTAQARKSLQAKERKGLKQGVVEAGSHVEVFRNNLQYIHEWPVLHLSLLPYSTTHYIAPDPIFRVIDLKDRHFTKAKQPLPQLGLQGYLFQLDGDGAEMSVGKVGEAPLAKGITIAAQAEAKPIVVVERPSTVVDLHFEKLEPHASGWSNEAILAAQLATFEKTLEQAIASNFEKITFIHGVGAGVLKDRIQKILAKHPFVKTWKDAQKEKFGYGATEVLIKD